jgi:hypothetical protein
MARSTKIKGKIVAQDSVEFSSLTAGTVPVLDSDKNIVSSAVTPTELSNLSGTTSPIQDQLDDESGRVTDIENNSKVLTVYAYENNAQVYADAQPGIQDPSALIRDGWYFKNSVAGQKINWYYFDGLNQGTVTLGELQSVYAVMTFDSISAPILAIYTVPTGTNDVIPGFAHSRIVYDGVMSPTPVVGKKYLVYGGIEPSVYPELPRIQLTKVPAQSIGEQLPTEQILTVSFGSSSGAAVNQVQYMVETLGLFSEPVKHEMDLRIQLATKKNLNDLEATFAYNQVIYVDKSNTGTYTANGSINKPYKTVASALAAITDASASKRYAIMVAPGTYSEDPAIRLKGWIDITSFATDTVVIGTSNSSTIKWSNNNPGRVFLKDIGFSVGLETLNDNPTGTSGVVFDLDNVDTSSLIFRGRGGGRDFIQLRNDTRISGSCTIQSASTTIFDSTNISNLTMNDVGCVAPDSFGSAITASIRSNYIGSISISATNFDVYTDVWGTIIAGNLTIVSNASSYPCYFNHDATSYPQGTINLSGTNPAQVVATSVAESIRYTPAVSGNWTSPVPANVKAALDNLAANKASLDGTGKVPASQLPSYVDDVIEVADFASLPPVGESGKIYVTVDTNVCYRWSGSTYVQITSGAVASVNGQTGIVVLDSEDLNHEQAIPAYWDVADNSTIKAHIDELAARREAQNTLTKEPTGFATRTESTTSFSDSGPDRTFTIAPVSTSFEFYVIGVKFVKSSAETLQIPNLSGNHFIYYNASGVLSSTQVADASLFQDNALIAIVYWNAENNTHSYFAEERHGLQMDGATHSYLHTVLGAQYLSGLALQNFVVNGNGSLPTHAQFTADEGTIRDEDLVITIAAQIQIPVLYRQGTLWRKKQADAYPMIYSGTAGYTGASGRLAYNQLLTGNWQLTELSNNSFVLIHLFGTNDKETPVVAIQGIAEYGNITAARLAASSEITSLSGLPFAEFVALGSVVVKTADAFTNIPKAAIVSVNGGNYVDFRGTQLYTPAGVATSHNLLSGLAGDDHIQYHTDARGDARYYTKAQVDTLIGAGGSAGDITEKSYTLSNSQVVPENITDFVFSNAVVRSFEAQVSIKIDATLDLFEEVVISGIQKGSDWDIAIKSVGDNTGVQFSITTVGQVQYTSPNFDGFVSGIVKFRAVTTSV